MRSEVTEGAARGIGSISRARPGEMSVEIVASLSRARSEGDADSEAEKPSYLRQANVLEEMSGKRVTHGATRLVC